MIGFITFIISVIIKQPKETNEIMKNLKGVMPIVQTLLYLSLYLSLYRRS